MKHISVFKNEKELTKRGKYWQKVLGLENWAIKFILTEAENMILENVAGESENQYVNRMAVIRILKDQREEGYYFNQPQEQVLIHELLHTKIIALDKDNKTIEETIYVIEQHRIIEDLSKALFEAKYDYKISDYYKD